MTHYTRRIAKSHIELWVAEFNAERVKPTANRNGPITDGEGVVNGYIFIFTYARGYRIAIFKTHL